MLHRTAELVQSGQFSLTQWPDPSPNCCSAMTSHEALVLPSPQGLVPICRIELARHLPAISDGRSPRKC